MSFNKVILVGNLGRDPELRERLWPDYPIGCKRIIIADTFYPAMARPNVDVVSAAVDHEPCQHQATTACEKLAVHSVPRARAAATARARRVNTATISRL